MTGNVDHNMGDLSSLTQTPLTATGRVRISGSTQVKKRNQRERMNSTFMNMRTVDITDFNAETASMGRENQLTTRE